MTEATPRARLLAQLDRLGIGYELTEHPAVHTIEEMQELGLCAMGEVCKNLFLRDQKGKRHFLAVLPGERQANLAQLAEQLQSGKLSFASEERLGRFLGLERGAVTPFGLLNDESHAVEVALDAALVDRPRLGFHPNDNTATVWVSYADLRRFLEAQQAAVRLLTL